MVSSQEKHAIRKEAHKKQLTTKSATELQNTRVSTFFGATNSCNFNAIVNSTFI